VSIKTKLIAGVGSLALAAGGMAAFAVPAANAADTTLLSCTGTSIVALLNPTLGSADAKYTKVAVKRIDATNSAKYHASLTGGEDLGPSTQDTTSCSVNSGIRTNNTATNSASGKDNPFDNQTNGLATLNMTAGTPFVGSIVGSTAGSATCNRSDPAVNGDFPQSYPLQGKLIFKFSQADAAAKQIQLQAYTRLGTDPADSDVTHITVVGTVIKGPGVGGDVHSTFGFGATFSNKNLNLLDCVNDNTDNQNPRQGNASLASLIISPADGSDVNLLVDPFTVTIPA
jgi:hypothetical protein